MKVSIAVNGWKTAMALADVLDERVAQDEKWGEQHHPDISSDGLHSSVTYAFRANQWKSINAARVIEGCIARAGNRRPRRTAPKGMNTRATIFLSARTDRVSVELACELGTAGSKTVG